MSYREMTAPDMVKEWRKVVNDYVSIGRDAKLIKQALETKTPCQILLGMYRNRNAKTITIPMFLREEEDWLELDELRAEIELAIYVSSHVPPAYYIMMDNQDQNSAMEVQWYEESKKQLIAWSDKIVG